MAIGWSTLPITAPGSLFLKIIIAQLREFFHTYFVCISFLYHFNYPSYHDITCILILIAASGQCNKCISVLRYGSAFKTRLGTKLSYLLGRQLRVIHFPCGTRHKPGYQLYAECALRCQIIQSRMLVIIVLRSIPYERSEHWSVLHVMALPERKSQPLQKSDENSALHENGCDSLKQKLY